MSPVLSVRPGRAFLRAACLGAALSALLAGAPAFAVVGGVEERGPLARTTLMVLNARGGTCSGVVLGPNAVLTAAHCVADGSEVRLHFRKPDGSPALLEPRAVAVHPGYDRSAIAARRRSIDLALVRTAEPLPAAFGAASLSAERLRAGDALTLAGYGLTRDGDPRSGGAFRSAALAVVEPYGSSTILVWAADPARSGAGGCQGDSGGPIATGAGQVVAITSWTSGSGRARCGEMSQGVLVGPQRAWIEQVLAGWGAGAPAWR